MRYKLTLSYRGESYAGWQRQPNAVSVQEVVEAAVSEILGCHAPVTGAGRTDAGVHARGQVAHVDSPRGLPESALVEGVNARLPEDVRVMQAEIVADTFHARYDAVGKEYRYAMTSSRVQSPLDSLFCLRLKHAVDVGAMTEAARAFVGRWDFSAFAKSGGAHGQPVREVMLCELEVDGPRLFFRVIGEGFLRGMVRAMVGTLLEVGTGRLETGSIRKLLEGRPRSEAGANVPANGLVLEKVFYDPRELEAQAGRGLRV